MTTASRTARHACGTLRIWRSRRDHDGVLRLPVNHQLAVISGLPVPAVITMLSDPAVQAQADALARRIDNGYRDYTASLLRELVIPRDLLPATLPAVTGSPSAWPAG